MEFLFVMMKYTIFCIVTYSVLSMLDKKIDFTNKLLNKIKSRAVFMLLWIIGSSILITMIAGAFSIDQHIFLGINIGFISYFTANVAH